MSLDRRQLARSEPVIPKAHTVGSALLLMCAFIWQYVVIAAGGHSMYGSTKGASVAAYKLRR